MSTFSSLLLFLSFFTLLTDAGHLGKSTYAMSHPFAWKDFMERYFPTAENLIQANSTATCVEWAKLCIDDGHMTVCHGPSGNTQLHSVGAYMRDSGKFSMEELEGMFTQAIGDFTKYDPFMDNHVGFFTNDLDYYINAFKADSVPYFPSKFTDPSTQKEYYAILIQAAGSLNPTAGSLQNIMLFGNSSTGSENYYKHMVPRASSAALARAQSSLAVAPRKTAVGTSKPVLAFMHVSFASSDANRDKEFFETALLGKGKLTMGGGGGPVDKMYAGVFVEGDAVEVLYVQSTIKTQGPMSVAEWETYQKNLHSGCFDMAANTGFDRLADNHLGHSLGIDLTPYINAVKKFGLPYRFYGRAEFPFFYIYWPNGWGVSAYWLMPCRGMPIRGGVWILL